MRLHPDMEIWWSKHGDHLLGGLFFSPSWSKDQFSPYRILLLVHIIPFFFDDIPVLWWNWYGSKLTSPRIGVFTLKDLNLWPLRSLIWLIHIFMVLDPIHILVPQIHIIRISNCLLWSPSFFMIVPYYDEPRYFYSPMLLYYILMTFPHVFKDDIVISIYQYPSMIYYCPILSLFCWWYSHTIFLYYDE